METEVWKNVKKKTNVYMSQGLGNQLFIYSYILNLFQNHKSSDFHVKILFNRKSKSDRFFLLAELINLYSKKITYNFNNRPIYFYKIFLYKMIKNEKILRQLRIFHEKNMFVFEKELLKVPNNSLVVGYYLCKQYVDNVSPILISQIREWLHPQLLPKEFIDVDSNDVIILHVRRGDTVGKLSQVRGTLSKNYYQNAIESISKSRNMLPKKIIAITDDLISAKKDLQALPITHWMGPKEVDTKQALKIFSVARNFVGANSTLSWWGALISSTTQSNTQILPFPWLGFKKSIADDALFIDSALYINAE